MLKNQLKIAFRNLVRNGTYSLINITGLTLGFASVLLIVVYVVHELSYDRFHQDADRIYRVSETVPLGDDVKVIASTSLALPLRLRNDYPELENVTWFSRPQQTDVVYQGNRFYESRIHAVDPEFFKVFSYEFINGTPEAVMDANTLLVTESIAKKYFGKEDAIGKTLTLNQFYNGRDVALTIVGVIKDMPVNSHFHMDFIIGPRTAQQYVYQNMARSWGWDSGYTYIKVPTNYDVQKLDASFPDFINKHLGDNTTWLTYFTRPLTEIHLESNLNSELETNGNRQNIYVFSIIALAIIFIASVNYINMATAIASKRSKEVGVLKTLGATRGQLVRQYVSEALVVTLIATLLGGFLAEVLTPYLNELAGKEVRVGFLEEPFRIVLYLAAASLIGLLSSIYPALYLSSFQSMQALQGKSGRRRSLLGFRKGMLVIQFGISIFLIIASITVFKQWDFLRNKQYGLNTETTLTFSLQSGDNLERFDVLKTELEKNPAISNITTAHRQIARGINNQTSLDFYEPDSTVERLTVSTIYMQPGYLQNLGVKLKEGRYFLKDQTTDVNNAVLINEAAVQLFKNKDVLGRPYRWDDQTGTIIGVTEDFHFESIYNKIKPMMFIPTQGPQMYVTLSVNSEDLNGAIDYISQAWTDFDPKRGFRYSIVSEDIRTLYEGEEKFLNLFTIATGLAIFIACLGIFGLVSFSAYQRTKEIGIRKVLGAGVFNITFLLTRQFLFLILIGNLIAWPMAWLFTDGWLANYSYRIGFLWWPYLLAAGLGVLIAILTASTQTIQAAKRNPVDSLRYE